MKFYVYVYRDPRPTKSNEPFYVGKGTGRRDVSNARGSRSRHFQRRVSNIKLAGFTLSDMVTRVFQTDDEDAAYAEEMRLIQQYGRRDLRTGPLVNQNEGGWAGAGAMHWTKQGYREKVITRQKEGNARPEVQARRSEVSKETWQSNTQLARKIAAARQTPESREKTKQQALTQWAKPEYAAKMKVIKAEIDARPEVSEARSSKLKARWDNPIEREQRRAAMKAAAKDKYKPVHAMPEDKTYESVTAFCAACGVVRSTAYLMLKGGEMKQGKFKGWTLKYV